MTTVERIPSFDGQELAVHRVGEGRPAILLHGLFSNAKTNWIKFGHAQRIADAGFAAIMPDLRAHGESAAPHEAVSYPAGVLGKDVKALVEALGLTEFDLVGFSLGARTAAAAVIDGLRPRKLVLAGMGLEGVAGWNRRADFFIDAIDRCDEVRHGDPAFLAASFMKTMKIDRVAARFLLQAVTDIDADDLARLDMPTAVISGDQDADNGSPQALVNALPNARYIEVPGTHMSSVTLPDLGEAITAFLSEA